MKNLGDITDQKDTEFQMQVAVLGQHEPTASVPRGRELTYVSQFPKANVLI